MEKENNRMVEIMNEFPILFHDFHRGCDVTCQCWGLEMGEGWYDVVEKYARIMELANTEIGRKFNVAIRSDQTKSKYGYLCWYYSAVVLPCRPIQFLNGLFYRIYRFLNTNIDYKLETVIEKEACYRDSTMRISKEEYEKSVKLGKKDVIEIPDGGYASYTRIFVPAKKHVEVGRHRLLFKLKELSRRMFFATEYCRHPSKKQVRVRDAMEVIAEKIVKEAENECSKTCEICGSSIGSEWSPICTTSGWIMNICESCAKKDESQYYKNGKLFLKGKEVKKKEKKKTGK